MLAQTSATATSDFPLAIVIAIIVIAAVIIVALVYRRSRTETLRRRFGPEYDREVKTLHSQSKAEAELTERERRHRSLHIKPLTPGARERYIEEWQTVQSRFVDDPREAIGEAVSVIQNVMRDRGYPLNDFNTTTKDLSVEHADVLDNYRMAHEVSLKNNASTEELRQAVIACRSVFDRLVVSTPARNGGVAHERA
jgi:FtsZ-interacting cell division protein ZipA